MWTPLFRGPDWMPITPKWGSFLHAGSQPKELRTQAAGLLMPYKYSKMGTTPVPVPWVFIGQQINLQRPHSIQEARENIAYLSELKATGQIDQ